jgi:hypothetical protein
MLTLKTLSQKTFKQILGKIVNNRQRFNQSKLLVIRENVCNFVLGF